MPLRAGESRAKKTIPPFIIGGSVRPQFSSPMSSEQNQKFDFKKLVPHGIAVALLLVVSCIYFAPNVFGGKALPQPDNDKARAMQTEVMQYLKSEGEAPLWTNSAFGGMPAYQIYSKVDGNLTTPLAKVVYLGQGITSVWAFVFGAMLCMYLFLSVLRLDWRVALFGALAFGITTYNMDLLEAGHSTKMSALSFVPGMFAGAVLVMGGRFLLGGGLLALFTAFEVNANHIQITYYALLLLGIYFLVELVWAIRHKGMANWGLRVGTVIIAFVLGFGSNTSRLWPTLEYSEETTRGKSELTEGKTSDGGGLDKDYAFGWSCGISESLSLIVPRATGGGGQENIQSGEFYDLVSKGRSPQEKAQLGRQVAGIMYSGDQPFVGTAIYFGAIVCFLFFLGAFLVRGVEKWWLLLAGLFSVSLAWGKYFPLNDLLYAYFPMFNKFRAVTMAFGLGQLCFAALAALGLQKLFDEDISKAAKLRAVYIGAGVSAVFCLLAMMLAGGVGPNDAQLAEQIKIPNLESMLSNDRAALARADAFRSLGFIAVAAALIWLHLQGRLKATMTVLAVAAVSLFDNWSVCRRTLADDDFEPKKETTAPPAPKPYDNQIKQDPDPHYRVLDLSRGSFTANWTTSYFHKSLTGYHAAKLQRYQEVIDSVFGQNANLMNVAGMMNTKYIVGMDGNVVPNPRACGHAWFVKHWQSMPTADAELQALRTLNPRDTAVVWQKYSAAVEGLNIKFDSTASIKLTKYHPDKMEYEYSCATEQLAVFPEIYYPEAKGWHCYLNGERKSGLMTKVDYLLRGVRLPAGQNVKFEMRFEPDSFVMGERISLIASLLVLLAFFAGLYVWYRRHPLEDANRLTEPEPPAEQPKKTAVAEVKKPDTKRKK